MNATMRPTRRPARWTPWSRACVAALLLALLIVPRVAGAQEPAGFDGFVQSGTCAEPTDDVRVQLDSGGAHDVEPYLARDGDQDVLLGYYGAPQAPGFGLAAIYTDRPFSLVVTEADGGGAVACGDILRPDADRFTEAGVAVVQLLPVEGSDVQGVAAIQRTQLQRELDVTPTRVRIVLSTDAEVGTADQDVAGYDGHIRTGSCDAPAGRLRVDLRSRQDHDVNPYLAEPAGGGDPVTLAYHGAPGAPGFGLAAAHTSQRFSLVITGEGGDQVSCGEILVPASDTFTEAGLALVRLEPEGDAGVPGYAVIERTELQRELDITPTRVRVLLFAPPATGS